MAGFHKETVLSVKHWNETLFSFRTWRNTTFPARSGLFLWLVAVVFIGWKAGFEPGAHTVVDAYWLGGERWAERVDLYSGPHGFIYMPLFAALFAQLTTLSEFAVNLLWRALLTGLLFYGLHSLTRVLTARNQQPELLWQWFGLVSLVALPIAFSGLRNGQMNVWLSAVMVLGTAWIIEERWNRLAVVMAFIMALKPTFAVFFLLAGALYRPLWWRLPPLTGLFLLIPFAIAGWQYGSQQYLNFIHMSERAMDLGMAEAGWATFFNIFPQLFGFYIPEPAQLAVKIPLAAVTLFICYRVAQKSEPVTAALVMLTLACCYHMLFNPRSVNTDYVIIGSAMAFWVATAACLWKDKMLVWLVAVNALLILLAYELSKLITPEHSSWMNPLATTFFTLLVLWQISRGRRFLLQEAPLQQFPENSV